MEDLLRLAKKAGYTPVYYKVSTIEERRAVQSDPEFWKSIATAVRALQCEYGSDYDPMSPNFRYNRETYKKDPNYKQRLLDIAYKLHKQFWENYFYSGEMSAVQQMEQTLKSNYEWNDEE